MHGNFVPVHERDLVPLRREKATSPANAWELVPVHERDLVPLRREKATSPANAWGLCSRA